MAKFKRKCNAPFIDLLAALECLSARVIDHFRKYLDYQEQLSATYNDASTILGSYGHCHGRTFYEAFCKKNFFTCTEVCTLDLVVTRPPVALWRKHRVLL